MRFKDSGSRNGSGYTMTRRQTQRSATLAFQLSRLHGKVKLDSMSEVCVLLKLLMIMPATNAVSETSPSGVGRVKTYLRSTMSQLRFNSLLLLHVYKERKDELHLEKCLNEN